jgi:hypothetical protein
MRAIQDQAPAHVIQIGDLGDWSSLSTHHTRGRGERRNFAADRRSVRASVADLQSVTPKSGVLTLLGGNHDAWLDAYLVERAPEMEDAEEFDVRTLLGLRPRDRYFPYRAGFHLGKVYYTHDIGHCGAAATRQNLVAAGHCIVTGHTHRAGIEYGGTILGDRHFSMSVGWMGDPAAFAKQPYMPIAKMKDWQRGLGVVTYDSKWRCGFASFSPWVNGRLVVNGSEYR